MYDWNRQKGNIKVTVTSNTMKWGFVNDLQIPYEDQRAVALWFKVMKWWKPNAIDVVGDIDDQLEYSSFSDGTTDEFFSQLKKQQKEQEKSEPAGLVLPPALPFIKKNADGAKAFYTKLRQQHKNADIHASLGNHDCRIFKYLDKKDPTLLDEVSPNILWGLDDLGITYRYYHEKPFLRFADTYVHHGTTVSTTGPTVGKDIESLGVSLVRGHSHKALVAYKTYPMTGVTLHGLECGHMCDINAYGLQYADNPSWQQGFGLAHVSGDNIQLEFIPILNYTCWVDGKFFEG